MKVLSDTRRKNGWVEAVIEGRWVEAKVIDEPSDYGVNGGRVSKLTIGITSSRDKNAEFFPQMQYSYDRGLDFDNLPEGLLEKIVAKLESLNEVFEE